MSKSLSTGQDALARRSHVVPINLIKLTDYAESATWYLSDRAVSYDYDGSGAVEFFPWVKEFGALACGMSHLPAVQSSDTTWELSLSNETWEGERIAETLDAETLEGASIEWAQLLADESITSYPADLSAWSSTDKTIFFTGVVRRVGPITEQRIGLACSADLPTLPWAFVTSSNAPDASRGARVPLLYGDFGTVQAVPWSLAPRTNLDADLSTTGTTVTVVSTADFTNSGTIRIETELITYAGKTATTFTGCTRGVSPSSAAIHYDGDLAVAGGSSDSDVYVISGNQLSTTGAVTGSYDGYPGDTMPTISTGGYTINTADYATIPGAVASTLSVTGSEGIYWAKFAFGDPTGVYVDVDGPAAPYTYTYTVADDCEATTGLTRASQDTSNYVVGSASIKCEPGVGVENTGTALSDGDDYGDWSATTNGAGWTIENNTSEYTEGSNSVRIARDDVGDDTDGYFDCTLGTPIDLSSADFRFDMYVADFDYDSPIASSIWLIRSGDGDLVRWHLDGDNMIYYENQGWVTVVCKVADAYQDNMGGDYTGIDTVRIDLDLGVTGNYCDVSYDNFQTFTSTEATTGTSYKTFSSEDWSDADAFNVDFRVGGSSPDSVKFWVSSDTPSGTTPPTNRWEMDLLTGPLLVWQALESRGATQGSPTMSAIISWGITVDMASTATQRGSYVWFYEYPAPEKPTVWIDDIRYGEDQASRYKVASGTMLEHPADIFRHLVEVVAGETVDETSVVAAETDLGSNKMAFDSRSLGFSWVDIVSRLAYESRANVVPRYTSTGTRWAFLTADSSYEFDTSGLSVSTWEPGGFALVGRANGQDLFTRFSFHYNIDPSIGYTSEAYTQFLRAAPGQNDLSAKVATADIETAEAAHGISEAPPLDFVCIRDETTAIDVAGYIVHELLRRAKLFAIRGVPWYDGEAYALELGDIRNVTPPWSSTAVKCRVIEIIKDATEQLELRLVEVE